MPVIKYLKIALLFIYVFFNAGLSYSFHYCGDVLQQVNLFGDYKTCCESTVPVKGCCDDINNLDFPNSDQQVSEVLDFQVLDFSLIALLPAVPEQKIVAFQFSAPLFVNNSPPERYKVPIYLFDRAILI
jgi:hypothetical protein